MFELLLLDKKRHFNHDLNAAKRAEQVLALMSNMVLPMLQQTETVPFGGARFAPEELNTLEDKIKKLITMTSGAAARTAAAAAAGAGPAVVMGGVTGGVQAVPTVFITEPSTHIQEGGAPPGNGHRDGDEGELKKPSMGTRAPTAAASLSLWEVRWIKATNVLEYDDNIFNDANAEEFAAAFIDAKDAAVGQAGGDTNGTESVLYSTVEGARAAAVIRMRVLREELGDTDDAVVQAHWDNKPSLDYSPPEDTGSLVDFTQFASTGVGLEQEQPGLPRSGVGLHFQRCFWGGDPYGADLWNKCEARIDVWVARRKSVR